MKLSHFLVQRGDHIRTSLRSPSQHSLKILEGFQCQSENTTLISSLCISLDKKISEVHENSERVNDIF